MVCFSVIPDQSSPVNTEHSVNMIDGNIMHQHVIASLKECRVYSKNRDEPLLSHASRHCNSVFFGDPYVKEAVRKSL